MRRMLAIWILAGSCAMAHDSLSTTLRKSMDVEAKDPAAAIAGYQSVIAQVDEQRKIAATALFRLAECYRKLHQDVAAKTAYERVVREFGEQTALVERSRAALQATSASKNVELATALETTQARQRYRNALEQQILAARTNLDFVHKQAELGAASEPDITAAQLRLLEVERELAAFEIGVPPASPGKPAGRGK